VEYELSLQGKKNPRENKDQARACHSGKKYGRVIDWWMLMTGLEKAKLFPVKQ